MVTPAAKVYQYPPPSRNDDFSKITEKNLGDFLIADMSNSRDHSQYGIEKGISVNYYLIIISFLSMFSLLLIMVY
jgi:hypothetical protein